MIRGQVDTRRRNEGSDAAKEIRGQQAEHGGAVRERALHTIGDVAVGRAADTVEGDGRAPSITAEAGGSGSGAARSLAWMKTLACREKPR